MSETKFSCPLCSQHIACDSQYGGRQIQCPSCQAAITVPAVPAAVKAVATPSNAARPVSVAAKSEPAPASPVAPAAARGPFPPASAKNPKKILTATVASVVAVIAIFFLGKAAIGWQAKFDEANKRNNEGGGMVGGHLSHIKTLNDVMDATEPGGNPEKLKRFKPALAPPSPSAEPAATNAPAVPPSEKPASTQASAAAAWTLDVEAAQISKEPAAGTISGSPFSADTANLDVANSLNILALRQGTNLNADQALFCYLYLKPGETIAGRSWTISKDTRVGAPQILKRWKPSFAAAAKQQTYTVGYSMKLEFGQTNGASIPGKIYIALPDPEQSCVSGEFTATVRAVTLKSAAPSPAAVPAARPPPNAPRPNPNAVPTQRPLPRPRNPGGYSVPFGS